MPAEQATAPRPSPARTLIELPERDGPIELVAIGASAGGVEALTSVVGQLPADFPAAVLVVLHVAESGTSVLPAILDRSGPLPATAARDNEAISPGRIYVSPPAHHLTVAGGAVRLDHGPRENGHRPAVDPLFRAVGAAYGPRAVGVVLSGARDDGSAGLRELKLAGGLAIVQDPEDALYAGMPRNAMRHVDVDVVLPVQHIGFALARLASRAGPGTDPADPPTDPGVPPAAFPADLTRAGRSSRFACPDCGGVLFEFRAGQLDRFACLIGHAYSFESLFEEQSQGLEQALWAAIRSLEDRAVLLRRMERSSRETGGHRTAQAFEERAREATERARTIRAALQRVAVGWRMDEGDGESRAEQGA